MGEGLPGSGRLHGNLWPRTVRPFFFSQFSFDLIHSPVGWAREGCLPLERGGLQKR